MSKFRKIVDAPVGTKHILQGNAAFALGVVHAGFHAADGYPGTPSTEVIDRSLAFVQDRIKVGWSVNEAVSFGVGVGQSAAGFDTIVTMKIPGVFQAADAISSAAFYTGKAGALILFVASDYIPASTQNLVDVRYFLDSCRLPILEPRSHQEIYEFAGLSADISRKFNTPVVVLTSGTLTHSEGSVISNESRKITPREVPADFQHYMLLPSFARIKYDVTTRERIPAIQKWTETSKCVTEINGSDDWGIITNGVNEIIIQETLQTIKLDPSILSLAVTNPLPEQKISEFVNKVNGKIFVIEDGYRYLEGKLRMISLDVIGKKADSVITDWTPESLIRFLKEHLPQIKYDLIKTDIDVAPVPRPPAICPGCPYRAFALTVDKLKRRKKIEVSFGDIGCSTLLYFLNALDTVMCMGASESMRQGFAMMRPEKAGKLISIIGDSTECHSGLDATRNTIFRNVPGVKVILDNRITAMTGGQPAPTTAQNLEGQPHKFNLVKTLEAQGSRTIVVDSYNMKQVDTELKKALKLADEGEFTTLVLEGPCIHEVGHKEKVRSLAIDYDQCKSCGLCGICPGIELDENKLPTFTSQCSNCGSNNPVCQQRCPFDAIVDLEEEIPDFTVDQMPEIPKAIKDVKIDESLLPESLRIAIRGIGGQGNLFFGKILAEVAFRTPYQKTHIVKGDTHGMAQLGGPVISVFSCGKVHSPVLAPNSVDVLIVMELGEILRPGFVDLLKPEGTIIFNSFIALPDKVKKSDYPDIDQMISKLTDYHIIKIDALQAANELGDATGKTSNVVVLGLLSTISPFNLIPEQIWMEALLTVSPNDFLKSANIRAFKKGQAIKY